MNEEQSIIKNSKLLDNLLTKRTEFAQAKLEYVQSIEKFCGNAIEHTKIIFHGNKMYVTFESFSTFSDKYLLKFCNVFGFLAPRIEFKQLSDSITIYKWEFIKIL